MVRVSFSVLESVGSICVRSLVDDCFCTSRDDGLGWV